MTRKLHSSCQQIEKRNIFPSHGVNRGFLDGMKMPYFSWQNPQIAGCVRHVPDAAGRDYQCGSDTENA